MNSETEASLLDCVERWLERTPGIDEGRFGGNDTNSGRGWKIGNGGCQDGGGGGGVSGDGGGDLIARL